MLGVIVYVVPLTFVLAPLCALTIIGAAGGEMGYYVLGSIVELVLLAVVMILAVRWKAPRKA